MPLPIEYALLANASYRDIRGDPGNVPVIPSGWERVIDRAQFGITGTPHPSGFSAEVYRNAATQEIVISYQGTNAEDGSDSSRDWSNNILLFNGGLADQLREAAATYARVRKLNPGATITLTGHSLGGGLASLVAIYFGEAATVFAPAPFRQAANLGTAVQIQSLIRSNPALYADDNRVLDLAVSFDSVYAARAANVRGYYVQGEALETHLLAGRIEQNAVGFGNLLPIVVDTPAQRTELDRVGLHSMQLHVAAFESSGLRDASAALPELLRLMNDASIYAARLASDTQKDFVQKLLELQFGGQPGAAGTLDRFGADMQRIAKAGLLAEKQLREAAIVAGIEHYNFLPSPSASSFITDVLASGTARGIRFDLGTILVSGVPPNPFKSRDRLVAYLKGRHAEVGELGGAAAPEAKRVWILQGGAEPLVAAESTANATVMVGFTGDDQLTGGGGDDLLIGDAGNDRVEGGGGADVLLGGAGTDDYVFVSGAGFDRIRDSDGGGRIMRDAAQLRGTEGTTYEYSVLAGGTQEWRAGDLRYVYTDARAGASAALEITSTAWVAGDRIAIENFDLDAARSAQGYLGIRLGNRSSVSLKSDYSANAYAQGSGGSGTATLAPDAGGAVLVTLDLSAPAQAGDVAVLSQTGLLSTDIVTGAQVLSFTGGNISLPLSEGQTQVTFALWSRGNLNAAQSGTLTATLVQANPDAGATPAQATATVNLAANTASDTPPVTTYTITGDQAPGVPEQRDAYGNIINGVPAPGRNDFLNGSPDNDRIEALGGSDTVNAGAGDDHVLGGEGDDALAGQEGADRIEGEAGRDFILAGAGNDLVLGGAQNDSLLAGDGGDDRIFAGTQADEAAIFASDTVTATPGSEWLDGGEGKDRLIGSSYDNVLLGGAGEDLLAGGAGADTLHGDRDVTITPPPPIAPGSTVTLSVGDINAAGAADFLHGGGGNDFLYGEVGADTLLGAGGDDELQGDGATLAEALHGGDFLDGGAGDDRLFGQGGNDALYGGAGNDLLQGDDLDHAPGDDYLSGEDGEDTLIGVGGKDVLYGGAGNDQLFGDSDDTPLAQQAADELYGGEGDDTLQGYGGDDLLDGGAGVDTVLGGLGKDRILGGAGNDILVGDEGNSNPDGGEADNIDGGAGDDQIFGQGGDDTLFGGEGADLIQAGVGNDQVSGGAGDDTLIGVAGADRLDGGEGADELQGGDNLDILIGGAGDDRLFGDAGNDTLQAGAGIDRIQAGEGDDNASGGEGNDLIFGEAGDDLLAGDEGADELQGGADNDRLEGGAGEDILNGGPGADTLIGGEGRDLYVYSRGDGLDTISDTAGNTLRLNFASRTPDGVRSSFDLELGSLKLNFFGSDVIHIEGFDPDDPLANPVIDRFEFADGVTLALAGLLAQGFSLKGTLQADVIEGTVLDDTIDAFAGDDVVIAKAGRDTVDLGSGDDIADAGEGNDTVLGQEGADIIFGGEGFDTLFGGEGNDQLFGGAGDDLLDGGAGADRMAGGPGRDLYVLEDALDEVFENPGEGNDSVASEVSYTLTANVEDLTLGGASGVLALSGTGNSLANRITGNDGANVLLGIEGNDTLRGGGGADTLDGGPGADFMAGGAGGDFYRVDDPGDVVWEPDSAEFFGGFDTVEASVSYALAGNVEELVLTGTANLSGAGNSLDNRITGNAGDNALFGHDGNDSLEGGEGADRLDGGFGDDAMAGGAGDDTYVVSDAGDQVLENPGEGSDTVQASLSYTLTANVENLVLAGSGPIEGRGNALENRITGGAGDNALFGIEGNDTLLGGSGAERLDGGAGADFMAGGAGADTYVVDEAGDLVTEESAAGRDGVEAGVSYTLTANVEELRLQGLADLAGSGNELANVIVGNEGANVLAGLEGDDVLDGGAGADFMDGGAGADTYYVDSALDVALESGGIDIDSVFASVTHTLGANLERLSLTGNSPIDGSGNALENRIAGNEANNVLAGLAGDDRLYGRGGLDRLEGGEGDDYLNGGAGEDVLAGGAGDDRYVADSPLDQVIEAPGEGVDHVLALDSFSLPGGVENLTLRGDYANDRFVPGLSGEGNELDNVIVGNDGANFLAGREGADRIDGRAGSDFMTGDAGEDVLYGGDDAIYTGLVGDPADPLVLLAPNADFISGGEGADDIDGGSGDDQLFGEDGDDVLFGGADGLTLGGGFGGGFGGGGFGGDDGGGGGGLGGPQFLSNNDLLEGGAGADALDGGAGDDRIFGGAGADYLFGGADGPLNLSNNDLLDGGEGIDTLVGGTGNDTYDVDGTLELDPDWTANDDTCLADFGLFHGARLFGSSDYVIEAAGEGYDVVFATASVSAANVEEIRLGGTADIDAKTFGGSQLLVGNAGANILAGGAGADTMLGGLGDDTYYVDDGSDSVVESADEGSDWVNSALEGYQLGQSLENLRLEYGIVAGFGNEVDNVVIGNEGDNELHGEGGGDTLAGREGNDLLFGGADDDLYVFGRGWGEDTVFDAGGGFDKLMLQEGILAADIALTREGDDVVVTLRSGGERVVMQNWFDPQNRVEFLSFCDGNSYDAAQIEASLTNQPPVAPDDFADLVEDLVLTASGNVLDNDSDEGDFVLTNAGTIGGPYGTLTLGEDGAYAYALDNASVQALAEGESVTDAFAYTVTDTDPFNPRTQSATLTLRIAGSNDAPVTIDDAASVQEDGTLVASGNVLGNDSDVDTADVLNVASPGTYIGSYGTLTLAADGSYTYALNNGSAAVQSLRAGEVLTDSFTYLASDGLASTLGTLTLSVAGANDNPLAGNDSGAAQEDGPAVTLLASTLLANDTDADAGDTKAITAVTNSAAGAQVTLVAGDAVYDVGGLFQSLKAGATATDSFVYTMLDAAGAASTATVVMTIAGVNDAPVVANPIADQSAQARSAFSFTFGTGVFTDIDAGDVLSYSASLADGSALPAWLAFDAATRTFAGTPPGGGCDDTPAQTLQLLVRATDTAGASASDDFALNLTAAGGGGGQTIIGTPGDDVLTGTACDDTIDGGKGFDKMSGGKGDDTYYVDETCATDDDDDDDDDDAHGDDEHEDDEGHGEGYRAATRQSGSGDDDDDENDDDDEEEDDEHAACRVDQVIERANEGYDTVLSQTDYTLAANVEELRLAGGKDLEGRGNALDNVLAGNSGDNRLAGEAGNDIYVYAKGGGEDLIEDSGGSLDALRFGAGIATGNVAVRRSGKDLVLRLSGGEGSVTAKDWFASPSKRIEQVQFADGTVWNEQAIRARLASGGGGSSSSRSSSGSSTGQFAVGGGDEGRLPRQGGGNYGESRDAQRGRDDRNDRNNGDDNTMREAIAARLERKPDYDFSALAAYLARQNGGGYSAMTPAQIAKQWRAVQNRIAGLAQMDDDSGGGHGGSGGQGGGYGGDGERLRAGGAWGHAGSTGQGHGVGGMGTFSGLGEGFRRL